MPDPEPARTPTPLTAALTALCVPSAFAGVEQWGRLVARAVGDAVCADRAALVVRSPNRAHVFAHGADAPAHAHAVATRPPPGAWCRRASVGTADGWAYDAAAVAGRAYDAIGVTARTDIGGLRAAVICQHAAAPSPAELRRHLETLAQLGPAVAASVRARADAARERRALTALIDAMRQPAALYDLDGAPLHANSALDGLLADEPEHALLARALAQAARDAAACAVAGSALPGFTPAGDGTPCPEYRRRVDTAAARYALHARLVGPRDSPTGGTVAVTVERGAAPHAAAASLRKRYALTERELDVTQLLGVGRSNADIATALGISASTARHHTESVLAKLGARSRAEVPVIVSGGR